MSYLIPRNFGLGAHARRPGMHGLGIAVARLQPNGGRPLNTLQPVPKGIISPGAPIAVGPAPYTPPPSSSTNAGTPVPSNFPTNQFFVNSDGSVWEYGASGWFNTGTPYNNGASSGSSSTSTTGVSTAGTPVPAGYPTNATFTASDGSLWSFNAASNTWQYAGVSAAAATSAAAAPLVAPAAESDFQSLLDWLPESNTITGVPNYVIAGVAVLAAWKLFYSGKK